MKRRILVSLISVSSILTMNAQIYDTGDKVGIGTTNPVTKLDVLGDMTLGLDGSYNLLRGRAAGAAIQFGTNSATWDRNLYLGFVSNTFDFSPLLSLIHQTGSVGIGITYPSSKLHIVPALSEANVLTEGLTISRAGYVNQKAIFNYSGGGINIIAHDLDNNTGYIDLKTWNGTFDVSRININTSGNVGIGTTNPGTKLDVMGDMTLGIDGSYNLLRGRAAGAAIQFGTNSATWDRNLYLGFVSNNLDFSPLLTLIHQTGNVGIGTVTPSYRLDVVGTIRACEVKVNLENGCDFVFKNNYKLMDLKELELFVKTNQHLPEVASEKEMVENGVNMKEMQMKLLQKMEEMTLYIIEQQKQNTDLAQKLAEQFKEIEQLKLLITQKLKP